MEIDENAQSDEEYARNDIKMENAENWKHIGGKEVCRRKINQWEVRRAECEWKLGRMHKMITTFKEKKDIKDGIASKIESIEGKRNADGKLFSAK